MRPAESPSGEPLKQPRLTAVGCSGIGSIVNRLPDDAAARGYVSLPKPVTLPRTRYTTTCVPESLCAVLNYLGKASSVETAWS